VSGLADGHVEKLLNKRRSFADVSLPAVLGATGLELILRPDPVALAKVQSRLVPRQNGRRPSTTPM